MAAYDVCPACGHLLHAGTDQHRSDYLVTRNCPNNPTNKEATNG